VIAADFGWRERLGHPRVRVAHDGQVVAEGLERAEAARAQVEGPADGGRVPEVLRRAKLAAAGGPVHLLDADEPRGAGGPARGRPGKERARREHRVQ
jgi:hypothetical protein